MTFLTFNQLQNPVLFNNNGYNYLPWMNTASNFNANTPLFNFNININENDPVSPNITTNTKHDREKSNFNFCKSLLQNPDATVTTLQVGHDAEKIKGYYAENPDTGDVVYVDENGQRYTKEAFENWEQFSKDGTFLHFL